MEIGLGHRYSASFDSLTIATSPASYDLILLAPAAAVPIIVDRIAATAAAGTGTLQRVTLQLRSTASTGGTAVVPKAASNASPAASTTVTHLNLSTTGTASGTPYDSQIWNQFAPYEWNEKPGGILIPPAFFLALFLPAAPTSTIAASYVVEFIELK